MRNRFSLKLTQSLFLSKPLWLVLLVCLLLLAAVLGNGSLRATNAASAPPPINELWQDVPPAALTSFQTESLRRFRSSRTVRLNRALLAQTLGQAPLEAAANTRTTLLSLPLPNGQMANFRLENSPVLPASLAAKYPDIQSYRGAAVGLPNVTMRCDDSPRGFHATILMGDETVTIQRLSLESAEHYVSYFGSEYDAEVRQFRCEVKATPTQMARLEQMTRSESDTNGAMRKTYRLAIATTQEYTNLATLGGGSAASSLASVVTWLNAVNLIYEQDLSVRFVLAEGNDKVMFTAEPDGLTNGNNSALLSEIPGVLNAKVGATKYDVGHVLHLNAGGSGVAFLGVACGANNQKGAGVTGVDPGEVPGAPFSTSTLAHEIGHQFSATHTFAASCDNNRQDETAYESASGLTLMSYAGVCNPSIVARVRPHFHSNSIGQMLNYIGADGSCATTTATNNNPPTINVGTAHTIPKQTPFILTATGNDADAGDVPNLMYSWEQSDAGPTPPFISASGPLFRPFPLTTERSRTYPSLTYILNNANVPPATISGFETAENLPNVARMMTFNGIVRDLRGGIGADQVIITAADSGPFLVTQPNTATTLTGGATQTVTWSVNGTNAAPVNCANVKITMSLDGGNTFPHVLAASVPNSGTAMVNVPGGLTSAKVRIKIEAVGNIFFDISDVNATLTPGDSCPAIDSITPLIGAVGSNVTIKGVNFNNVTTVKFANNVNATFLEVNDTTIIAQFPTGAVSGPITINKTGCTDKSSTAYRVIASAPTFLSVDDGSRNSSFGFGGTIPVYYVNRLTPMSYPSTITAVSINIPSSVPIGTDLTILVGTNPGGGSTLDSISFQTINVKTTGLNQTLTFAVPNITITAGDFVVGFAHTPQDNVFPIAVDTTPTNKNRSYVSNNLGGSFTLFESGNFMIRAEVNAGAICGANECNAVNTPPSITAAAAATRVQASAGVASPVATVSDAETAVGNLTVTATSVPSGITVSNIANTNGNITATIAAACNAATGDNTVQLTVSDGALTSTANFTVTVTANTAPALSTYPTTTVGTGQSVNITPLAAPSDNGSVTSLTASAPSFTGSFSGNASTGVIGVTNAGPNGTYTVTVTATDNCGATATTTFQLTVSATAGLEADVAPRPNGNGSVSIVDWTQVGRFVAGLDTAANGTEFQRADVAPRDTFGNGSLTISDWVQAGRYAVGQDPTVAAAGPTSPSLNLPARPETQPESTRVVRARNQTMQRGQVNAVSLLLDAVGNENALGFTANFDPALLSFYRATAADGTLLTINAKQARRGMIGVLLALPVGQVFEAGQQSLITLEFIPNGGAETVTTTLSFGNQIVASEAADASAATLTGLSFTSAELTISGRAAAHVSAASYLGAEAAADSIVSAFGDQLSTMTEAATASSLPSLLGGTRVTITDASGNEKTASLFFVSPNQINYLLPAGLAEGIATVTITNAAGSISRGILHLTRVAPAVFSADASGQGYAAADVQRVRGDGSSTYERVARFDPTSRRIVSNPIELHDAEAAFLVLYGTGLKQRSALTEVKARFGGLEAEVLYAGPQGQYAGLDQLNIRIPSALRGRGEITVELEIDGRLTNPVKIFVK
ncbi:MAG: hypothetical protein JNM09_16880 [Blastocatellia bacterium]|nr:hypothetical protein [Blastocatellia bacterium]